MARWEGFSTSKHPRPMRKWAIEHAFSWRNAIVMVRLANSSQKSNESIRASYGCRAIKGQMYR